MLAGYDEEFSSTQQLVQCVRPGILLDAASVPSVQMTNRNGQVLPLNRYILDYWGHGQKQALVHANGLREGVLLLSHFRTCIIKLTTCIFCSSFGLAPKTCHALDVVLSDLCLISTFQCSWCLRLMQAQLMFRLLQAGSFGTLPAFCMWSCVMQRF